jgi:UDP-N-acetylglucosamine transferase subunit ALG13
VQRGHTIFYRKGYKIFKFLTMDKFKKMISHSKILIIHGGAGSIINALNANKKPIVMPRLKKYQEHVNDHQLGLVKFLYSKKMILIANDKLNVKRVLNKKNKKKISNSCKELKKAISKYT